jgi:hypothetical protein
LGFCFNGPNCGRNHDFSTFADIPLCDGSCGIRMMKTPHGQVYYWGKCKNRHRGETVGAWGGRTTRFNHLLG